MFLNEYVCWLHEFSCFGRLPPPDPSLYQMNLGNPYRTWMSLNWLGSVLEATGSYRTKSSLYFKHVTENRLWKGDWQHSQDDNQCLLSCDFSCPMIQRWKTRVLQIKDRCSSLRKISYPCCCLLQWGPQCCACKWCSSAMVLGLRSVTHHRTYDKPYQVQPAHFEYHRKPRTPKWPSKLQRIQVMIGHSTTWTPADCLQSSVFFDVKEMTHRKMAADTPSAAFSYSSHTGLLARIAQLFIKWLVHMVPQDLVRRRLQSCMRGSCLIDQT